VPARQRRLVNLCHSGRRSRLCLLRSHRHGASPTTEPARDLRMADFGHLLAAHDAGCGTRALDAYRAEVDNAFDEALAGDPLATAVIAFMDDRDQWSGTASDLLARLDPFRPAHEDAFWPKTAHHLSQTMTRSSASLRRVGIVWTKPAPSGRDKTRLAHLTRTLADAADAETPLVVFDIEEGEDGEGGPASTTRGKSASASESASASGGLF
jgi:hypothetical protein